MEANNYIQVRLQYNLEIDADLMKAEVEKLCDVFCFRYECFAPEDDHTCVFFNIYYYDNPLFSASYGEIIKVFALQEGLLYLGADRCPLPKHLEGV